MTSKTMEQKCADHARIAARHVKMKSLDPGKAGVAFMAEGLALIYGIDGDLAGFLAKLCCAHAAEMLIERSLEQARQDGASEAEMVVLLNAAAEAKRRGPGGALT
jgi:hypothetical protein